ncbi:MAG: DNA polymerase III subunit chi [Gammaproteobacteria bacterium]|nr:DNA polymerase III subunit chi [Gammaproteobacteria bacterium]
MSGRVDFYLLGGSDPRARHTFACRLAEKIYLRGLRAVLLTETAEEAKALDQLLWTFSDRSFVPHSLCDVQGADEAPVRLTADAALAPAADVLVNLGGAVAAGTERFARVAEIVDAEPTLRARARERFKAYRDLQFTVETHQIDGAAEP